MSSGVSSLVVLERLELAAAADHRLRLGGEMEVRGVELLLARSRSSIERWVSAPPARDLSLAGLGATLGGVPPVRRRDGVARTGRRCAALARRSTIYVERSVPCSGSRASPLVPDPPGPAEVPTPGPGRARGGRSSCRSPPATLAPACPEPSAPSWSGPANGGGSPAYARPTGRPRDATSAGGYLAWSRKPRYDGTAIASRTDRSRSDEDARRACSLAPEARRRRRRSRRFCLTDNIGFRRSPTIGPRLPHKG